MGAHRRKSKKEAVANDERTIPPPRNQFGRIAASEGASSPVEVGLNYSNLGLVLLGLATIVSVAANNVPIVLRDICNLMMTVGDSSLPAGWRVLSDRDTGRKYYWNDYSKESQWEHPAAAESREAWTFEPNGGGKPVPLLQDWPTQVHAAFPEAWRVGLFDGGGNEIIWSEAGGRHSSVAKDHPADGRLFAVTDDYPFIWPLQVGESAQVDLGAHLLKDNLEELRAKRERERNAKKGVQAAAPLKTPRRIVKLKAESDSPRVRGHSHLAAHTTYRMRACHAQPPLHPPPCRQPAAACGCC